MAVFGRGVAVEPAREHVPDERGHDGEEHHQRDGALAPPVGRQRQAGHGHDAHQGRGLVALLADLVEELDGRGGQGQHDEDHEVLAAEAGQDQEEGRQHDADADGQAHVATRGAPLVRHRRVVGVGAASRARDTGRGGLAGADGGDARRIGFDDRGRQQRRLLVVLQVEERVARRRSLVEGADADLLGEDAEVELVGGRARRRGAVVAPDRALRLQGRPVLVRSGARPGCGAPRPSGARSSAGAARCRRARSSAAAPRRRASASTRWPGRRPADPDSGPAASCSSTSCSSSGSSQLRGSDRSLPRSSSAIGPTSCALRPRGARALCGPAPCRSRRRARG